MVRLALHNLAVKRKGLKTSTAFHEYLDEGALEGRSANATKGGGGLVKGGEEDGCERFGNGEVEACEINTEESIVEGDNGGEGSSYLRIAEITDECDGGEEGERGDGEGRT